MGVIIAACVSIGSGNAIAASGPSASLPPLTSAAPAPAFAISKLSAELKLLSATPDLRPADAPWARLESDRVSVKVLIVAASSDPELASLRADVLARGGSVFYNYLSVRAVAAMVPANALVGLASRADVLSIAPNRSAQRQASLLQTSSNAAPASLASAGPPAGLDGRGVGIAVLDSGIDFRHRNMSGPDGGSRVRMAIDIVALGRSLYGDGWNRGVDYSPSTKASIDGTKYAKFDKKNQPSAQVPDAFGHGTAVAAAAAGAGGYQLPDSSGIAPGADLYDVRVLNDQGVGNVADVLAGIDWVMQHARLANIRVMNLSLGAASTDSFLVDPLARAARSAAAGGVVVVASAGNAGKDDAGIELYGTVSSPGSEPSVITVGAENMRDTPDRADDVMATFSSRGPTRGALTLANGYRWVDNLIKPDLVAPGNRVLTALAGDASGQPAGWNGLARAYPQLSQVPGATQLPRQALMTLSGTSIAAPAVAGAVAILLQANPGLTPPLVKAILQYSATPLASGNLLQQGTGLLNVEGAVRLARAIRPDIASTVSSGAIKSGDNMLVQGMTLPNPVTVVGGKSLAWSRMAYAGGTHLVSGEALFSRFQPIWDPTLLWARHYALRSTVSYYPASGSTGVVANTVPSSVIERSALDQPLLTAGVRVLDGINPVAPAGASALTAPLSTLVARANAGMGLTLGTGFAYAGNGIQADGFTLSQGFIFDQGFVLREGLVLNEGFVLREGFLLSEGFVLREGFTLNEGFVLREGFTLNEGFILRESTTEQPRPNGSSYLGD